MPATNDRMHRTCYAIGLLLLCAPAFAQPTSVKSGADTAPMNSVMVVKELIRIDDAAALAKARQEKIKLNTLPPISTSQGPTPTDVLVKPQDPPASVRVDAIYGTSTSIKADITYNGVTFHGSGIGTKIQACRIQAIDATCIKLTFDAPAQQPATDTKSAQGKNAARQKTPKVSSAEALRKCPASVCWTGEALTTATSEAAADIKSSAPRLLPVGAPMPSPLPTFTQRQ